MYAILENGVFRPAPRKLKTEEATIYNPTPEQLSAAGYKPVTYTDPPEEPDGYYAEAYWTETEEAIVQAWRFEEIPPEEAPTEAWDIEQSELIPTGRVITVRGTSYECIQEHTAAWSRRPPNAEYWWELC